MEEEGKINRADQRGMNGSKQASGQQSKRARNKSIQPLDQRDFENILERISDGVVVFDAQMNYTYVNQRAGELLGRKPEDLIGKNCWVEYPEARGTPFAEAYDRALQTQEPLVFEDYYEPFDRWFENRIYPSKDGLVVLFTEVTDEKKKAELNLREAQERLALAVRSANIGLWDWDLLKNKVYYSPEWKSQLGHDDHEISNDFSEWESRVHPEDLKRAKEMVMGYIEHPHPDFRNEFRLRHKDGSYRWILAQASLQYDTQGKPVRMIGSHVDITERKRVESEMKVSRDRLAHVLDSITDAFITLDRDWRITYVNPEAARINKKNTEEFLGKTHWEEWPASVGTIVERQYRKAMKEQVPVHFEHRYYVEEQHDIWLDIHAYPSDDGLAIYYRDISERKRAEEELRLSHNRLAELSRRLVESHETEQRAIGRELHDQIGQMLTALKLTLEITPQLPPEKAANKFAQAQELVDGLLERVSSLSLELRPPMLDDLGLVPAFLWHINRYQEQSGIEVDFKHSGVEGKRFNSRIETTTYRIVQEALTNVTRHAQATQVRLEIRAGGEQMEIRIEDNGKGFEVETALARNRGLSGMRERASLLGGTFHIESQVGEGTKKTIELPLVENEP